VLTSSKVPHPYPHQVIERKLQDQSTFRQYLTITTRLHSSSHKPMSTIFPQENEITE